MVAASSQVLPDKQGYEEQRQHTQEAEAAKVTKPWGTAGGGKMVHVSSGMPACGAGSDGWGLSGLQ
jgi:hypothetical protein